ncbi:MAG: hypothetical protein JSV99_03370 [Planctomycetota bacterium]|nr:MAG: hypothetical protein JSV99_03370 [Planctomycetota bacterium]
MGLWRQKKRRWFIPKYDELTLFMMSVAFLLLFFSTGGLRSLLYKFWREADLRGKFGMPVAVLIFSVGIVLSLYHVFTERRKTEAEKFVMLFFAVLANAAGGILAGTHILSNWNDAPCILMLFPLWNIINGILLILLLRAGEIDTSSISDENARSGEVIFGFVIILGIFVVCRFVFELYWALTFSICVVYATSFSDALGAVFGRAEPLAAESTGKEVKIKEGSSVEKCAFCERVIPKTESPWVIKKRLIVCKECYHKLKEEGA